MSNKPRRSRSTIGSIPTGFADIDGITTAVGKLLVEERVRVRGLVEEYFASGSILKGEVGFEQLSRFCAGVEASIASLVAGKNGLDLFEGVRRVSGRLWATKPLGREIAVRSVCELGLHRYADWTVARDPAGSPRPWNRGELRIIARLIVLAELIANGLSARRRVGKGAESRVHSTAPLWFEDSPDDRLQRMINLVDRRSQMDPNPLSTVGAQWPGTAPSDDEPWIIAARRADPSQRDELGLNGPRWHDPLVDTFMIDSVETEVESLEALNAGLDGFDLRHLHFALDLASTAVQAAWEAPPATLLLSGYALALPFAWDVLDQKVEAARSNTEYPFREVTVEGTKRALDFLDAGVANTDLDLPLAQRPLRRVGGLMLYDALHVHIAGPMLWDIALPEDARDRRARSAEPIVHSAIGEFGVQPWPSGHKLKADGRTLTDIDASVVIETVLVAVDCYASPWSSDLDRGHHNRIRTRLANLREKLQVWDQRWAEIARAHAHVLPPDVDTILPVLVSAQAEWIDHDESPLEWLERDVPRICTVSELQELLRRRADWKDHPAALHVKR